MWLHLDRVSGAHERVVRRRHRTDGALGGQLDQPVERKHNVPVLLEAGPVEIYRDVAGQQLGRPCRGRDHPVVWVAAAEGIRAAHHEAGGGNDPNSASRQRWSGDKGTRIKGRALELGKALGLCRRKIGQSSHAALRSVTEVRSNLPVSGTWV